jgi:N-acetylneuraminate synthase
VDIAKRLFDENQPPFVIAELSGNHSQNFDTAKKMILAAAQSGADAVKLQTYTADTLTLDVHEGDFYIDDESNLWHGSSLYQLYQKAMTPWEWHQPLFEYANSLGLFAFSSPFDLSAVEYLESIEAPAYKIASFENVDHQLLAAVAKTNKPVIVSTGMASQSELAEAVQVLQENGCANPILLKCTSRYPALPADANLLTLPHLRDLFDCTVGLSDHTEGLGVAVASVACGARVIEKHFVLDRSAGGVDAEFSMEPTEFAQMVQEIKRAYAALGKVSYGCTAAELESRKHRRSLYISADMKAGDVFTTENIRSVRPGLGLPPKYLPIFLGKKITKDAVKGTRVSWELL